MSSAESGLDYRKVEPTLALAYDEHVRRQAESAAGALAEHPAFVLAQPVADLPPSPESARVIVTVECAPDTDFTDLDGTDIEINPGGERIRTGIAPLADLPRLARHAGVLHVAAATELEQYLDVAAEAVHLPAFRTKTGATGKGVIVGVVDSGLDAAHPAFAGRVLKVWDQKAPSPEGKRSVPYGIEYTGSDLTSATDENGHGTMVAGIAAGNDRKYCGVAPAASIIAVKAKLIDSHVIDAIRYVFRAAEELGRPAVVNLSLGGQRNPHDGTDPLSQAIDELSGPGKIVCCAAGNDGDGSIHAQALVAKGSTVSILCSHVADPGRETLKLSGWYSGDDEVEVALRPVPETQQQTEFQPISRISGQSPSRVKALSDGTVVTISTPERSGAGRPHQFDIQIKPRSADGQARGWALLLRGRSTRTRVDVWVVSRGNGRFAGPHASRSMTIGSPGCATSAITVGAYTTRTEWSRGSDRTLKLGGVTPFSGRGPRRDGLHKPDVVAPGAWVISARSGQSQPTADDVIDAGHVISQGTSMASPFVAGVVALLLSQSGGKLTAQEVLNQLDYAKDALAQETVDLWGRGLPDLQDG